MHYIDFWKSIQLVGGLDDLAQSGEKVASEAAPELAATCDGLFDILLKKAGDASGMVALMLEYQNAHEASGEKIAASAETRAALLQKLATATYLDTVVSTKLAAISPDEFEEARAVQLLGREYAVHLMRGLLT